MSERRYGKCPRCNGAGIVKMKDLILFRTWDETCGRCDGSGANDSADDYLAREYEMDLAAAGLE
jgi:DnaJ-class molecular chaperone